ncbi:unnamed protein product [Amoebophrya sp. A25]|nr:unnamed protein product [Amoebophrya sp. A25]|eukprot:GSA25T00001919001.1
MEQERIRNSTAAMEEPTWISSAPIAQPHRRSAEPGEQSSRQSAGVPMEEPTTRASAASIEQPATRVSAGSSATLQPTRMSVASSQPVPAIHRLSDQNDPPMSPQSATPSYVFSPRTREQWEKDRLATSNYNGFRDLSGHRRGPSVLHPQHASRLLAGRIHDPSCTLGFRSFPGVVVDVRTVTGKPQPSSSSSSAKGRALAGNVVELSKNAYSQMQNRVHERDYYQKHIEELKKQLVEAKKKQDRQKKQNRMIASETMGYETEVRKMESELSLLDVQLQHLEIDNKKLTGEVKQLGEDNKSILLALYEAAKTKQEMELNVMEARKAYFAESDSRRMMTQNLRLHNAKKVFLSERLQRAQREQEKLHAAIFGAAM